MSWSKLIPGLSQRIERAPLTDFAKISRLGILRPDGMGDIVLTSGLLRELRRLLPRAHITMICQSAWASWMRTCPWVDEVVGVRMSSHGIREPQRIVELHSFIRRVWPLDLEVVIQPGTVYWYAPSRALAWFSGAPVRVCWEDPEYPVDTGGALHSHRFTYPRSQHETEKCFRMLGDMGLACDGRKIDSWWTPADVANGDDITRGARGGHQRLVALGLASSEPAKRWPKERYLALIHRIAAEYDVAFLAIGGPDVRSSCEWLQERVPDLVSYPGMHLPLGVLWSAISHCDLYIGNDTGFMHMAAAARVPVVAVVGVAEAAEPGTRGNVLSTGPYGVASRVARPGITPPGAAPDATLVPVDVVVSAALEMLREPVSPLT